MLEVFVMLLFHVLLLYVEFHSHQSAGSRYSGVRTDLGVIQWGDVLKVQGF